MADTTTSWQQGAATGLGPMPGTSYEDATRIVADESPELPFVPSLPARGVGADPIGVAVSMLIDLPAEVVPSGWRISRRPGIDHRRALDQRNWVTDAVESQFHGTRWVKIQVSGPWSLAAGLELPSGHRALVDPSAVDDLTDSLAEGLREWLADLGRRLGGASPVVQFDEPLLGRVLAGTLPTASGFGTIGAREPIRVREVLGHAIEALGVPVVVRAGPGVPIGLLRDAGAAGLAIDLTTALASASGFDLDALGEAVEAGVVLLAGTTPTAAPEQTATPVPMKTRAAPLLEVWRRWGFPLSQLADVVVPTPVDGLADVTQEQAVRSLSQAREIARALPDPPDDW